MPPLPAGGGQEGAATVGAELLALTYGAVVAQLLSDLEDAGEVTAQLDRMGRAIGARLVDEFLARGGGAGGAGGAGAAGASMGAAGGGGRAPPLRGCSSLREAADAVARRALPMFLGVPPAAVGGWSADGRECSVVLADGCPLTEFVELTGPQHAGLKYSQLLPGVVAGALEAVGMDVDAVLVRDPARGDGALEMRLTLRAAHDEAFPFKEGD